jgi:Flp pilus assembly protein TadG
MRRKTTQPETKEHGQALVLFALFLFIFLGFCGLSIDVGRYVWARTQMQAAVDSAALAGAQSMPNTAQTLAKATEYWDDNNDFIESNGYNVAFAVTYPPGNKTVRVTGDADVSTWFAKFFGVDHWHVSAFGDAESQVLDIAVVLDISGSMCFTSYPEVENVGGIYLMSPGRTTPPGGGFLFPKLATPIPAGGVNSITIELNSVNIFNSTNAGVNSANFGAAFNSSSTYRTQAPGGIRPGIIRIDNELFQITSINAVANTMVVTRAMNNANLGIATTKSAHATNAEVWANRSDGGNNYCNTAAYNTATTSVNGPHEPFDTAISNGQYFVTLFNSAYDKVGVASYSTSGTIRQALTSNFANVNSAMNGILYPAGGTNIAHGIAVGRQILDGTGKRANAVRVLVVLTDGVPNTYCGSSGYSASSYNTTGCSTGSSTSPVPPSCPADTTAITHMKQEAARAAAGDIIIYTIGLGSGVIDCMLQSVADIGGGAYYKAPSPADLAAAFTAIAERTHIALVK